MNKTVALYSLILLASVFISSVSQVMLKKAALKDYKGSKISEYLNPLVIFAYAIFFLATLVDIYAYKEVPLSMGPILEATGYIYVTVFGVKIFKEKINKGKIMALGLIILGIAVYSLG